MSGPRAAMAARKRGKARGRFATSRVSRDDTGGGRCPGPPRLWVDDTVWERRREVSHSGRVPPRCGGSRPAACARRALVPRPTAAAPSLGRPRALLRLSCQAAAASARTHGHAHELELVQQQEEGRHQAQHPGRNHCGRAAERAAAVGWQVGRQLCCSADVGASGGGAGGNGTQAHPECKSRERPAGCPSPP